MGYRKNRVGINIYDSSSFLHLKESGRIANIILMEMVEACKEGSTPRDLVNISQRLMDKFKVKSAFLGFGGYPEPVCISYNEKIVHGIPNDYMFKNGDVVSIDFGVIYKGHYSDNARTIIVGDIYSPHKEILDLGKLAFSEGLAKAYSGSTTGDIGCAIHNEILKVRETEAIDSPAKYKLYYKFQGHGIGNNLHESPPIPNIGYPNRGYLLEVGMCFCIEPVILYSSSNPIEIQTNFDGVIEINTNDGKPSSHYENQVYISEAGPVILTQF